MVAKLALIYRQLAERCRSAIGASDPRARDTLEDLAHQCDNLASASEGSSARSNRPEDDHRQVARR